MKLKELVAETKGILAGRWTQREGRVVPDTDDLLLGTDAVKISGTVLYADIADSTGLVNRFKPEFAAKVYKSYLVGACRIIRRNKGVVTAFDGDRVMAVYIGELKNTAAGTTGLQLNAFVRELNCAIKDRYPNTTYALKHGVGIDTSELFVAKTGIRNANDLVWVGRAANFAAKLCSLADETFPTYITENVYKKLNKSVKYGGSPSELMWQKSMWDERGLAVYRSSWEWNF
jgi:class 3 adenylate cyclase